MSPMMSTRVACQQERLRWCPDHDRQEGRRRVQQTSSRFPLGSLRRVTRVYGACTSVMRDDPRRAVDRACTGR
eukprot:6198600-Pleurochrysis_carterae.AAC.1